MRHTLYLIGGSAVLLSLSTGATPWFGKRNKTPPPKTEPVEVPSEPAPPPQTDLWRQPLPHPIAGVPHGLANRSVQACVACHPTVVEQWQSSRHASMPSDTLLAAMRQADDVRCVSCHLPIVDQHRRLDAATPVTSAPADASFNALFDATLSVEGVTCASCHMRDGLILSATPPTPAEPPPPHSMGWTEQLTGPNACATCHQLSWPGAATPLYDTVGEWQRSAYGKAGIDCASCHMGSPADHNMAIPAHRAISTLVSLPPGSITRGEEPQIAKILVQNTGSGHSFPTGSPWKGARLRAVIVGPPSKAAKSGEYQAVTLDLARAFEPGQALTIASDTRLVAGDSRAIELPLDLPLNAPEGPYRLEVEWSWLHLDTNGEWQQGDQISIQRHELPVR